MKLTKNESKLYQFFTDTNSPLHIDVFTGVITREFKSKTKILHTKNGKLYLQMGAKQYVIKIENVLLQLRIDFLSNPLLVFKDKSKFLSRKDEQWFVYYKDNNIDNLDMNNIEYYDMFRYLYLKYKGDIKLFNKYIKNRVSIIDSTYHPKQAMLDGLVPFKKIPNHDYYIDGLGNILKDNGEYATMFKNSKGHMIVSLRNKNNPKYSFTNKRVLTVLGNTFLEYDKENEILTHKHKEFRNSTSLLNVLVTTKKDITVRYHTYHSEEFKDLIKNAKFYTRPIMVNDIKFNSLKEASMYIHKNIFTDKQVTSIVAYLTTALKRIKLNESKYIYKGKVLIKKIKNSTRE